MVWIDNRFGKELSFLLAIYKAQITQMIEVPAGELGNKVSSFQSALISNCPHLSSGLNGPHIGVCIWLQVFMYDTLADRKESWNILGGLYSEKAKAASIRETR